MSPLHWDWQEVGREIVIVVVGVFIALAAQQAVDDWQWRDKVSEAEKAMRYELTFDDGPQMLQRIAMHPCTSRRLDEIRAAAESGTDRASIARLVESYWVDVRTWDMIALNAVTASDVISHMGEKRFSEFATAYYRMPTLERTNAQEGVDIGRLRAFRRVGGPISEEERDRLVVAVEALRAGDSTMTRSAELILPRIAPFGNLDDVRTDKFLAAAREHYGACIRDPRQT